MPRLEIDELGRKFDLLLTSRKAQTLAAGCASELIASACFVSVVDSWQRLVWLRPEGSLFCLKLCHASPCRSSTFSRMTLTLPMSDFLKVALEY